MRNDYSLFKRKDKSVWYFYYYEGKKRISKSTGKAKKSVAEQYVKDYLRLNHKTADITLLEYAQNFFEWESSEYIRRQLATKKSYLKSTAYAKNLMVKNHIIPKFGHFELRKINPVHVENWLIDLPLSGQTKQHITSTLKIIFNEALRERLIEYNPILHVESIALNRRVRTVLTMTEIRKLFPEDQQERNRIWGSHFKATLFYTILTTGLRVGEARALKWSDVKFKEKALMIERAIKADNSVGTTKADYSRATFLPDRTLVMLKQLYDEQPVKEGYIFGKTDTCYYTHIQIMRFFNKGLLNAGIDKKARGLDIHCLRHTYNTFMVNRLSGEMLRFQVGHKSIEMTQNYDHSEPLEKLKKYDSEKTKLDSIFK